MKRQRPKLRLHCSACGAVTDAACNCGVGYMSAGEFAAKAIAEHPEMSNRAIAKKTGVSEKTVRNVRNAGAEKSAPQTRVGLDGKIYPISPRAAKAAARIAKLKSETFALPPGIEMLEGDCRDKLKELADQSVHCIVTSPPYFLLRDYQTDGQIGHESPLLSKCFTRRIGFWWTPARVGS
jgi:hypothetical protein